jgi:acyl phosphate:glycerol-3-phosphate acyltransferase
MLAALPIWLQLPVVAVVGYLIGGISWSLLIGKWVKGIDLREVGSGNLGATNVARNLGGTWAVVVFALDFAKAAFAAWLAGYVAPAGLQDWFLVVGGASAVVGHVYSPYIKFRGGKGIAASAGAAGVIIPWALLWGAVAFFIVAVSTRRVSLGSLTIAAVAVPLTLYFYPGSLARLLFATVLAILIVWAHRPNIKRLIHGEEPKVSWGIFKDKPAPPPESDPGA